MAYSSWEGWMFSIGIKTLIKGSFGVQMDLKMDLKKVEINSVIKYSESVKASVEKHQEIEDHVQKGYLDLIKFEHDMRVVEPVPGQVRSMSSEQQPTSRVSQRRGVKIHGPQCQGK
eukprot:691632-Rhodomonas_salina.1